MAKSKISIYLIVLLYLSVSFATISHYGATWDEALGDFFFGERYVLYFLTQDPSYLDYNNAELAIHNTPFNLFNSLLRTRPWEYPPMGGILGAISKIVLMDKFHWIADPVDAYHSGNIVLVSLFLYVFYMTIIKYFDGRTALLSSMFLILSPAFLGHTYINIKDIPQACFFYFTVLALIRWVTKPCLKNTVYAGVLYGMSLSCKLNAIFIPVILVFGLTPFSAAGVSSLRFFVNACFFRMVTILLVSLATLSLIWPEMIFNPSTLLSHISYISERSGGYESIFNFDPILQITITTPPVILTGVVLTSALLFLKYIKWDLKTKVLVAWILVPVLRNSFPYRVNFDGIRHFIEFYPVFAIYASLGYVYLLGALEKRVAIRPVPRGILFLALALHMLLPTLKLFPYEYSYHNFFAGSLQGAFKKNIGATTPGDYWGTSYRKGLEWIREDGEAPVCLIVPVASHIVGLTGRLRLGGSFKLTPFITRDLFQFQHCYYMFVSRKNWYSKETKIVLDSYTPAYVIEREKTHLLYIYKLYAKSMEEVFNKNMRRKQGSRQHNT